MANEQQLPEIKMDGMALYREEVFTDRRAGTLRRMLPVTQNGEPDLSRSVFFSGQTQLLTPGGVLPLMFEIEANTLEEALLKFPDAVKVALEEAINEAREMRREASTRIMVPEAGGGSGLGGPGLGGPGAGGGRIVR